MRPALFSGFLAAAIGSTSLAQAGLVSNDGNYLLARETRDRLVVISTRSGWRRELPPKPAGLVFSGDSKKFLWLKEGGLHVLTLGAVDEVIRGNVVSFKCPLDDPGQLVAYICEGPAKKLVLENLQAGTHYEFGGATDYTFAENGSALIYRSEAITGNERITALHWVSTVNGEDRTIWNGTNIIVGAYYFDLSGTRFAFVAQNEAGSISQGEAQKGSSTLWCFSATGSHAVPLAGSEAPAANKWVFLESRLVKFTPDGKHLIFYLKEKQAERNDRGYAGVDVWSYTDGKLQSLQLLEENAEFIPAFAAAADVNGEGIVRLEYPNEVVVAGDGDATSTQVSNDYALVHHFEAPVLRYMLEPKDSAFGTVLEAYTMEEYNWNKALSSRLQVVSLRDGKVTVIKDNILPDCATFPYARWAPDGRFVVYYDPALKAYFSYELASGLSTNITRSLDISWCTERADVVGGYYHPAGIGAWATDGATVYLIDKYSDYWSVDLKGRNNSKNFTGGYAKSHNLNLRLIVPRDSRVEANSGDALFGVQNKGPGSRLFGGESEGFLRVRNNAPVEELLKPVPDHFYRVSSSAKDDGVYVLAGFNRQNLDTELYYTRDFVSLFRIDEATSRVDARNGEWVRWTAYDGTEAEGYLCKPRDFDPTKKYPLMIRYYEDTRASVDDDRDMFLERGYLFCNIGVHFTVGYTGPSAYNCVVSGAEYLSQKSFVDRTKIGIQGHSFGGYETYYIVTHTRMFAAALAGSGVCDYISETGTQDWALGGRTYQAMTEVGQDRIGATLAERPDLYIKNSPIFSAGAVETPLLIAHSTDDTVVPFSQAVEFFKALRRYGKRVWLLAGSPPFGHTYDDGAGPNEQMHIRKLQFFDHYLKGTPAPGWMLEGIPARSKGYEQGLKLDLTGRTPSLRGLLRDEEVKTPQQLQLLQPNKDAEVVKAMAADTSIGASESISKP